MFEASPVGISKFCGIFGYMYDAARRARSKTEECAVCGPWPEADRSSMRMLIDSLPLREVEQICDGCLQAFWTNCVVGPRPKRARRTKH
jgi:hypothetical protein